MAQFSTLIPAPLALLAILATAPYALGSTYSVLGGLDSASGVWGIPGSIFRDLVSQPNATGSINFSTSNSGTYSLQLNVTADVPLTNASESDLMDNSKDEYSTISILSLVGEAEVPSSNTTICYSVWSALSTNISDAAKGRSSQSGAGCDDMLSEQCISDLMAAGGKYGRHCGSAPALPQSCMSQAGDSWEGSSSTLEYNSTDPTFYMQGADPTSDRGNLTLWNSASTNIWPVLLAFISDDGSNVVELNCIRPDTFSEESSNPNDNSTTGTPTNGTSGTGSSTSDPTSSPSSGAIGAYRVSTMSLVLFTILGLGLPW